MREHRLAPDAGEMRVVVVPTPRAVGEADEILVHARTARGEERVDVDAVRAIRLTREEVVLDRPRELARRIAVLGRDDSVDDERSVEREPGTGAAHHGEVVGPHRVVRRPDEERNDRSGPQSGKPAEPRSPSSASEEQQRHEHDQDLADRPYEDEEGKCHAHRRRPAGSARLDETRGEQRRECERRRVERVTRESVEQEDIARKSEQQACEDKARGRSNPRAQRATSKYTESA